MKIFTTLTLIEDFIQRECGPDMGFPFIVMLAQLDHVNRFDAEKAINTLVSSGKIELINGYIFKSRGERC